MQAAPGNPCRVASGATCLSILTPQIALRREAQLLDRAACGKVATAWFLWSTKNCLVAPKSVTRNPRFAAACEKMSSKGWPVVLRQTGGDVTPQGPGILNISAVFSTDSGQPQRIEAAYAKFCEPILDCLEGLGVAADCGSVPGAFCDGNHNIVTGGRKLAGTAQRWRRAKLPAGAARRQIVFAHAAILLEADLEEISAAVNAFYALCQIERRVRPERHITLAQTPAAGRAGKRDGEFADLIANLLNESFDWYFDPRKQMPANSAA